MLKLLHNLQQSCGLFVKDESFAMPVWNQPNAPAVSFLASVKLAHGSER